MQDHPKDSLHWAHPLVREWFIQTFHHPTAPQTQGWQAIQAGQHTLIAAPTGSGKTLAAFLVCIDQLIRKALQGKLSDQTEMLYVSPLKALSNDIQKNLMEPLEAITTLAKEKGMTIQPIRIAVRTSDTLNRERQAMLKKPPHIIVTTPESFYLLLTAEKSRQLMKTIRTVIIDEIHALANNKRGTHLVLSLERLEALVSSTFTRIGLSATQQPISLVAQFLQGKKRGSLKIINIGHLRPLELSISVPHHELGAIASNELWDDIYDYIAAMVEKNRSTLVFVNTRRLAERMAHHLAERIGKEKVAAHHGSLSKKIRLDVENQLKKGELKILVATASLELGIDIGYVDLVCQIGSPRSIAVALQRIGRSGHWYGGTSKGIIFPTTRDELLESAALIDAIRQNQLDKLIIPHQPLDILAQQIVAACATNDWHEKDLYQLVKKSFHYTTLKRRDFNAIIAMLSEGIAGSRGRYSAYLSRDQLNGIVKGRRGSRLTAITSGGAIPVNGLFNVIAQPQGVMVGTLDEDFAVESNQGDVFLLGSTSWRVMRVESKLSRVLVEDAHGAPPTIPFWRGEAPARTNELSWFVSQLREKVSSLLNNQQQAHEWLINHCGLDQSGAAQLCDYIAQGKSILGAVPTQQTVIAERFFDESGGMQLIIHSPFGARINKAWGLALRKKFCRSFNFELQASATDDGINIALAEQHSFPLRDVFYFLHAHTLREVLTQAVLQSPLFATRWRAVATRSLALPKFSGGKKIPPNILRMRADDLLAAVFPDAAACQDNLGGRDIVLPDHPLIHEVMKELLTDALDIDGLINVIQEIHSGKINCLAVDTPTPSVFSHEILNANPYAFLDDAPLEERRARAVEMRRLLPEAVLTEIGKLDPLAIQEVQQQAWPDIRSADELHDFLQTVIALPESILAMKSVPDWHDYFGELKQVGRIGLSVVNGQSFWIVPETKALFHLLYPMAIDNRAVKNIKTKKQSREEALIQMLKGWLFHLGPVTQEMLLHQLQWTALDMETTLLTLESSGLILRGHFSTTELEWCERRLLAKIHRYTLGKLRKEIEPVTPAQFMEWLLRWQHVMPETQLRGEQGLFEVIQQLQGLELPANAWEKNIFKQRLKDYDPDDLDKLCLTGAIGWGRLSTHDALAISDEPAVIKRVMPNSVTPITFFVREDSDWLLSHPPLTEDQLSRLSFIAKNIYTFLQEKGASFFSDILNATGFLKAEIEQGLWELVSLGVITADGFDNLRALIDSRRRLRKRKYGRASYATGRWSVLRHHSAVTSAQQLESLCFVLLKRYGIVFRDVIRKEKLIVSWRDLLLTFRRLEDRGDIRGGRFVDGFIGEQFALPYAVESLRNSKKMKNATEIITLSSADPLNLIGIIIPGEKISVLSKQKIPLKGGNVLV